MTKDNADHLLEIGEEKIPGFSCITYAQALAVFNPQTDEEKAQLWAKPKEFGFTKVLRAPDATPKNNKLILGVETALLKKLAKEEDRIAPSIDDIDAKEIDYEGRTTPTENNLGVT